MTSAQWVILFRIIWAAVVLAVPSKIRDNSWQERSIRKHFQRFYDYDKSRAHVKIWYSIWFLLLHTLCIFVEQNYATGRQSNDLWMRFLHILPWADNKIYVVWFSLFHARADTFKIIRQSTIYAFKSISFRIYIAKSDVFQVDLNERCWRPTLFWSVKNTCNNDFIFGINWLSSYSMLSKVP